MLQLKSPGIYTQELASGVRSIPNAPTSVALFVGPTRGGIDGRPIRVFNFGDFERAFGGLAQTSNLSYSVRHFFDNGGGEAWVLRVPPAGAAAASSTFKAAANGTPDAFTLTALGSGLGGGNTYVEFDPFGIGAKPFDATAYDKLRFNLSLVDGATGTAENFGALTMSSSDARYLSSVVNDTATGSMLASVSIPAAAVNKEGPQPTGTIYQVGALPSGTYTEDMKVLVSVDVLKADASASDPAASIANKEAVVFKKDAAKPVLPAEIANALAREINKAVAADSAISARLEGAAVEVTPYVESINGSPVNFLRLRISRPTAKSLDKRLADATVTITAPGAGDLIAALGLSEKSKNPSRYRIGAAYPNTSQVSASKAAKDGKPDGQPDSNEFRKAVNDLDKREPFFNILCLPDLARASPTDPNAEHHTIASTIYADAAGLCERKYAFLLVDPPPGVTTVEAAENWKATKLFRSEHAAAFFPHVRVDDLLAPGSIRTHPPSGAIAGVFARIDGQTGPWQAPAGTEAFLAGVYGPSVELSDTDQGVLNPIAVNCIRRFPIYFTVNFGSRTVDGVDALGSDYKYIPVRRTASLILRSLRDALRWAVQRANGEQLWSELRVSVTGFMHGLFRQGAFKGTSAREAYFVQCDASTTSAADIAAGVVNIRIGFAPLKPAEFVVITLQQIVQSPT